MPMRLQISPRIWFILLRLIERRSNTAGERGALERQWEATFLNSTPFLSLVVFEVVAKLLVGNGQTFG